MSTRIRSAETRDAPWLLEQLRAFNAFYGTQRALFPADGQLAAAMLTRYLADHASYPFFVADQGASGERGGGSPVGFIGGAVHAHPFNPAIRVLSELFWWVVPEHRGSSAGARLLAVFDAYGRAHVDWIVMTLEARSPVKDSALTRRGYIAHERSFLKEVERV